MHQTLAKCVSMMEFLDAEDYIIPSHGLPMPNDIKGYDVLIDRVFRFYRRSGTMSYLGTEGKRNITVMGITMTDPYINALHDALVGDCRKFIKSEKKKTHMNYLSQILCKFGNIEFVLENWERST